MNCNNDLLGEIDISISSRIERQIAYYLTTVNRSMYFASSRDNCGHKCVRPKSFCLSHSVLLINIICNNWLQNWLQYISDTIHMIGSQFLILTSELTKDRRQLIYLLIMKESKLLIFCKFQSRLALNV